MTQPRQNKLTQTTPTPLTVLTIEELAEIKGIPPVEFEILMEKLAKINGIPYEYVQKRGLTLAKLSEFEKIAHQKFTPETLASRAGMTLDDFDELAKLKNSSLEHFQKHKITPLEFLELQELGQIHNTLIESKEIYAQQEEKSFLMVPNLSEIYEWVTPIANYLIAKYNLPTDYDTNSPQHNESESKETKNTPFNASAAYLTTLKDENVNLYRIDDFLANMVLQYNTIASPETLLNTMEYLHKYVNDTDTTVTMDNIHKLLLVSFYWALKIQEDSMFYSSDPNIATPEQQDSKGITPLETHATLGYLDVNEFRALENIFIEGVDYDLPIVTNSHDNTLANDEILEPLFSRISAHLNEMTLRKLDELFIKYLDENREETDVHYQVLREILFGNSKNLDEVMEKVASNLNAIESDENSHETVASIVARINHQPVTHSFMKSHQNELPHLLELVKIDLNKFTSLSSDNTTNLKPK